MSLSTKERHTKGKLSPSIVESWFYPGSKYVVNSEDAALVKQLQPFVAGRQITASEGHQRRRNGSYGEGGPFHTVQTNIDIGSVDVRTERIWSSKERQRYEGPAYVPVHISTKTGNVVPPADVTSPETWDSYDKDSLTPDGATAISLVAPTNPTSSLATLLAETKKDGFPSIPIVKSWKKRTLRAKSAGSEYLNYQFGWYPLVAETLKLGQSARHSAAIAKQYQRDEGKNVRREFSFPIERDETEVTLSTDAHARAGVQGLSHFHSNPGAKLTLGVRSERKKWFSGAFTYALPSNTDSFRRMLGHGSLADRLFGVTLSPDVLWELSPWSWAIDWFSNTGRVINNVTNFGLAGLVMRYGYMMEEQTITHTYKLSRCALLGAEDTSIPPTVVKTVRKVRVPANPFGFGIGWADLSPTQLAISAALGISRLR